MFEKPIANLSPFVIVKQLCGILGTPKSVEKLKYGTLLVECSTFQQAKNLLGTKTFFGADVAVSAHSSLNSCNSL